MNFDESPWLRRSPFEVLIMDYVLPILTLVGIFYFVHTTAYFLASL